MTVYLIQARMEQDGNLWPLESAMPPSETVPAFLAVDEGCLSEKEADGLLSGDTRTQNLVLHHHNLAYDNIIFEDDWVDIFRLTTTLAPLWRQAARLIAEVAEEAEPFLLKPILVGMENDGDEAIYLTSFFAVHRRSTPFSLVIEHEVGGWGDPHGLELTMNGPRAFMYDARSALAVSKGLGRPVTYSGLRSGNMERHSAARPVHLEAEAALSRYIRCAAGDLDLGSSA